MKLELKHYTNFKKNIYLYEIIRIQPKNELGKGIFEILLDIQEEKKWYKKNIIKRITMFGKTASVFGTYDFLYTQESKKLKINKEQDIWLKGWTCHHKQIMGNYKF